ncbi:MAG: peptidoglycan DD-metalloendopeptidase family protein [Methanosphaera sp.]|nr:peptidoglycan DD-metalloendopeptidase family protein [Methanosphaera sp.]
MSRVIPDSENRITNPYGNGHNGVDLGWRSDEVQNLVHANCSGTVAEILDNVPDGSEQGGGWGNYVLVKHHNGWYSRYAHLKTGLKVSVGQTVDENTVLGIMGSSGRAYGRHLHFEVQTGYSSTTRINPTPYLTAPIAEKPYKIKYQGHVEGIGWQSWVGDGETCGTTGMSLRLEGLHIDAPFEIHAWAHCQGDYGFRDYGIINKDTLIGTTGESRRLECLKFKGNFKYRVHIEGTGWSCYTKADGESTLGSVGQKLRIEAIEIVPL